VANARQRQFAARFASTSRVIRCQIGAFRSIYLFYRVVLELIGDRPARLLTTGLCVLSARFLAMMLMLFNPAKHRANFFVDLCLWRVTELWRSARQPRFRTRDRALRRAFSAYCSSSSYYCQQGRGCDEPNRSASRDFHIARDCNRTRGWRSSRICCLRCARRAQAFRQTVRVERPLHDSGHQARDLFPCSSFRARRF